MFPSRNIIGGNNTSINLNGINQTRKILAIDQETLYGPSSLVNFVINNGRVEFNAGSRLQFDGLQTNINLNNSRFTSNIFGTYNEHRGVYIYGQPNVTIENCIFEYGRYGIYGWLSYGGAPLTITNSVFRHNDWAIRSFDKGLNTFNCHFQNNNVAVSAISMSFPSFFFEGAVGGSVSVKNNFGINWNSYSTGSLTLDDPYINTNLYSGVRINRSPLYIKCGSISYNDEGIVLGNNSSLNMDDQPAPFNLSGNSGVTAINNNYTIRGVWMGYLNLNKGLNDLSPSGFNRNSTVSGTILPRSAFPIQANENVWNLSGNFSNSDYLLTTLNSTNVDIDDSSPLSSISACGQAIPPCNPCTYENPLEYCPTCDEINTDDFIEIPLNEATATAIDLFYANTANNYREAVNLFFQILMEEYINPGSEEVYLFDLNYRKMMESLGFAFSSGQIGPNENESGLCQEVDQVITVLDKMITSSVFSEFYERRFAFSMDKAQTFRLAGRRDLALDELSSISSWTESEEDAQEVESFSCIVTMEKRVLESELSLESEDIAEIISSECEYTSTNQRIRSNAYENSQTLFSSPTSIIMRVTPNPASDLLTIDTNVEHGLLKCTNLLGEVLITEKVNYATSLDLTSLPRGLYFVSVINTSTLEQDVQKVVLK